MVNTGDTTKNSPIKVLIVAVPETAGSALYGMVDVLLAAGNIWQTLVRSETEGKLFQVAIVSPAKGIFSCGNGIPVNPECSICLLYTSDAADEYNPV